MAVDDDEVDALSVEIGVDDALLEVYVRYDTLPLAREDDAQFCGSGSFAVVVERGGPATIVSSWGGASPRILFHERIVGIAYLMATVVVAFAFFAFEYFNDADQKWRVAGGIGPILDVCVMPTNEETAQNKRCEAMMPASSYQPRTGKGYIEF
jgi:hypothetical protein